MLGLIPWWVWFIACGFLGWLFAATNTTHIPGIKGKVFIILNAFSVIAFVSLFFIGLIRLIKWVWFWS